MSKKNNILITGGIGFIGSNLAKIILKKKIASKCILLDSYTGFINPLKDYFNDFRKFRFDKDKRIIIERGDASNFKLVLRILEKYKPTIIFHASAVPVAKLDNITGQECRRGSIDTTTNILECLNYFQSMKKLSFKDLCISRQAWFTGISKKIKHMRQMKQIQKKYMEQ